VFGDDGGAAGADGRAQDGEQIVVADAARGGPLAGEELFEGGVAGEAVGGADEGGAVAAGDADAPVVAGVAGLTGVEGFEREGAGGGARCGFEEMCAGGPVEVDVHDAGGGEAGVAGEAGADDGGRGAIEADRWSASASSLTTRRRTVGASVMKASSSPGARVIVWGPRGGARCGRWRRGRRGGRRGGCVWCRRR
jgi:hypothetical protein